MLQNQSVNRPDGILDHPNHLLNSPVTTQVTQNSGLPDNNLDRTAGNGLENHLVSIGILCQKHLRELSPSNSTQNSNLVRGNSLKRLSQFLLNLLNVLFLLLVYYVRVITALNLAHYKKMLPKKSTIAGLEPAAPRFVVGCSTIEPYDQVNRINCFNYNVIGIE